MKNYLSLFLLVLPTLTLAQEAPEKFRNPIFNDVLWSINYNFAHNVRITPTYIEEIDYKNFDSTCKYVTEDDKGILLLCNPLDSGLQDEFIDLHMYYARYQAHGRCRVWWCVFKIKDGEIIPLEPNIADGYSSEVYQCEDEKNKSEVPNLEMNCMEELKARGWDKVVKEKLTNEK